MATPMGGPVEGRSIQNCKPESLAPKLIRMDANLAPSLQRAFLHQLLAVSQRENIICIAVQT